MPCDYDNEKKDLGPLSEISNISESPMEKKMKNRQGPTVSEPPAKMMKLNDEPMEKKKNRKRWRHDPFWGLDCDETLSTDNSYSDSDLSAYDSDSNTNTNECSVPSWHYCGPHAEVDIEDLNETDELYKMFLPFLEVAVLKYNQEKGTNYEFFKYVEGTHTFLGTGDQYDVTFEAIRPSDNDILTFDARIMDEYNQEARLDDYSLVELCDDDEEQAMEIES